MSLVRYFYHATSSLCKSQIITANKLIPHIHNPTYEWMWLLDSKYKKVIPDGVWFCSTLYKGELPTISPYGTERVKILIETVLEQLGGKFSIYRGKDAQVKNNTYVRLMIVREGDDFDCLKYMEKLDLSNNNILKYIPGQGFEITNPDIWMEFYLPYHINTLKGIWDNVKWMKSK